MSSSDLDALLDDLERSVIGLVPLRTRWKPIWEQIRLIGASFKGIRYPTPEERQQAWLRFQSLIQQVREAQAKDDELRKPLMEESERHRDDIIAQAKNAIPPSGFEEGLADALLAPIKMIGALASRLLPGEPTDERKDMLLACSAALKRGWDMLSDYKGAMLGRHKQEAFEALTHSKGVLDAAWEKWKEGQHEAYEVRQQAREERATKHAAWRERVEDRIERLQDGLRRLLAAQARKEAHIEELREKRDSAWNDNFRELVEGWIEEEEERLREIREKIESAERCLEEEREKLSP
jgi:hypothetical protein